jgi:transmembrane sensor
MSGTDDIRAIEQQAARWLVRLRDRPVRPAVERAFDEWLARAPEHREAYMRCEMTLAMAHELQLDDAFPVERAACRQIAIDAASAAAGPGASAAFGGHARGLALAAAAVAVLVAGGWFYAQRAVTQVFQTGVGERRTVLLADRSTLTLNTDTTVAVEMTRAVRRIELRRGEAFFEVAHDTARPFEVHAAGGLVRAVGTRFGVELRRDDVTVSVLEGAVDVIPQSDAAAPAAGAPVPRLTANRSVHYESGGRLGAIEAADVRRITAWREGKLIFDDTPLADAIAEYNRYTTVKLVVGSAEIGRRAVNGVLNVGDFASLRLLLRESLGLTVVDRGDSVLLLDSRTQERQVKP